MRKWAGILAISGALGVCAPSYAAPISIWNYDISFAFTDAAFSAGSGAPFESPAEVSWGSTGGSFVEPGGTRSALTIGIDADANRTGGGIVSGTVTTNDLSLAGIGLSNTITHWNNVISADFAALTSGEITSTLTLAPSGGDPIAGLPELAFSFLFIETLNDPAGGAACAGGTPEPCADIFVLASSASFNVPFMHEGIQYLISIFPFDEGGMLGSIATLGAEQCAAAGAAANCVGIVTDEDEATSIQFAFAITTQPVLLPEPGMLGLLALGLFGMTVARRSRKV